MIYFIWLLFIWLVIITTLFVYMYKKTSLILRHKPHNIITMLAQFSQEHEQHRKQDEQQTKDIEKITQEARGYLQKIGFVRFNPFGRIGGEQSFTLAFLNKDNTGILITYLYTREGLRVYAKHLVNGVSDGHDLSEEEKEAIKKAK